MYIFWDIELVWTYKKWQKMCLVTSKMQMFTKVIAWFLFSFVYCFFFNPFGAGCHCRNTGQCPNQWGMGGWSPHLKEIITAFILWKQELSNKLRTYFECPRHLVSSIAQDECTWRVMRLRAPPGQAEQSEALAALLDRCVAAGDAAPSPTSPADTSVFAVPGEGGCRWGGLSIGVIDWLLADTTTYACLFGFCRLECVFFTSARFCVDVMRNYWKWLMICAYNRYNCIKACFCFRRNPQSERLIQQQQETIAQLRDMATHMLVNCYQVSYHFA